MRENKRYNEAHLVASLNEQKNIQIYEVNYQTNNKDKSQKPNANCGTNVNNALHLQLHLEAKPSQVPESSRLQIMPKVIQMSCVCGAANRNS